jgi:MFS family permease
MSARTESLRLLPWLVVGFGFLVLALSYSGRATLGLVMPAVEQDMGWTRTFLSGSAAASLIVMAMLAPLAGWMVDRHGPRMALIVGTLIIALGSFAVAVSDSPIGFLLAFGGLAAMGHGVAAYHVVSAAVAQLFTRNLGLATGIATSGSTAGQFLIVPLIAGVLVIYGWRWSFVVVGVACLLLVPVLWRLLPRGRPRSVVAVDRVVGRTGARAGLLADLRHVLRQPAFHILFWSFFICGYTTTGVIETHLLPFAAFCGFGPIPSANAYGILSAVNMAGMILVGWLADRMHRPLLLGMIYLLRGLTFILLINLAASADYGTLILFAVAFGVVDYSTVPVTASLVESHIGIEVMGLAMGLIAAGHSVGAALGAFLGGYLFELQAHYDWVWISSIILSLLAGLLVFTLPERARPMATAEAPVV